jgi:hypothetical protein
MFLTTPRFCPRNTVRYTFGSLGLPSPVKLPGQPRRGHRNRLVDAAPRQPARRNRHKEPKVLRDLRIELPCGHGYSVFVGLYGSPLVYGLLLTASEYGSSNRGAGKSFAIALASPA